MAPTRVLGHLVVGGVGCAYVYQCHQKYKSALVNPYTGVPGFDHGSYLVKHTYVHPETGDRAILIPLPILQRMRVFEEILAELYTSAGGDPARLPIVILQGFTELSGDCLQGNLQARPNYALLEVMLQDLAATFYSQWKQGKPEGEGKRVVVHSEDFFTSSVEMLGFPHVYGDLRACELQPLTQLFLLHVATTLPPDLPYLPKDSPLWDDLVRRRAAAAVATTRTLLAQRKRGGDSKWWWSSWFRPKATSTGSVTIPTPCTLALPWDKTTCPLIEEGLRQLGFRESATQQQCLPAVPFWKFLLQCGGNPFAAPAKESIFSAARARHDEMVASLREELASLQRQRPRDFEAMLKSQLTLHLKACRVASSVCLDEEQKKIQFQT